MNKNEIKYINLYLKLQAKQPDQGAVRYFADFERRLNNDFIKLNNLSGDDERFYKLMCEYFEIHKEYLKIKDQVMKNLLPKAKETK